MGHMNYSRVGRRCSGFRGFRLNSRRFSINRLRSKFLYLYRLFNRWRSSYGNALRSLRRNITSRSSSRRRNLVKNKGQNTYYGDYALRNYRRSNSFYSEAIADCLEFIKRSSVSEDEKAVIERYED